MAEETATACGNDEIYRDWSADRWAGSRIPALCDWPGCETQIDRGRANRCVEHDGDYGCELFFCARHLAQPAVHGIIRPKPDLAR